MRVGNKTYQSIWHDKHSDAIFIIDQTQLPHRFEVKQLETIEDAEKAIKDMLVRGAPLIGVTAAFGIAIAMRESGNDSSLSQAVERLAQTRPTAVNLQWALQQMEARLRQIPSQQRAQEALAIANELAQQDIETNQSIGRFGSELIENRYQQLQRPLNILTHCNAGWLATVDYGTALAPIYTAYDKGIPLHVWVDETRPRNQGASLTAWELQQHGIPHTLIVDNAGGHLMQQGRVDMCIVGSDRTCANGDVCNKIGTYLKALAAYDNHCPFYVALPSSTIDWSLKHGSEIPIEERSSDEVTHISGKDSQGRIQQVQITPDNTPACNPGFDVTPARLVNGLITEHGVYSATKEALSALETKLMGAAHGAE